MKSLFYRPMVCSILALVLIGMASCSDSKIAVPGRWVSDQTSAIALYFYKDGTASLSGTGFLKLEWKEISSESIRIDALDKKIIFHFKIAKDNKGPFGTLELAGYDTMVFRKK